MQIKKAANTHFRPISTAFSLTDLFQNLLQEFNESELSARLDIPTHVLSRAYRDGSTEYYYLQKIKAACGISLANFNLGIIDYPAVIAKLKNVSVVPRRYSTSSYSSKRTSDSILYRLPQTIVEDALSFLQVDENFYQGDKLEEKVSTYLNSDLLLYIAQTYHITDDGLYHLGQNSGYYHNDNAFGLAFKGLSLQESFSKVIEEIALKFETSFQYELALLNNNKVIIKRLLSEKIKDEQHVEFYSNSHLCKFIQGSFSAVAFYSTGKFAHTTEEKCIFRGDSCCEFHVNLNDLRLLS